MAYPLLLHGRHGEDAVYETVGEWLVPWRITSIDAEYQALRTGVGLIDYSTQGLIQVQGADRAAFLHNLLTNDIKRLTPGSGCRAALLTANAKLIADLLVAADQDSVWLLCDAVRARTVTETLQRYQFSEDVTITNRERRQAVLALQGPRTMAALAGFTGAVIALPAAGDHARVDMDGLAVWMIRWDLAGAIGVLCLIASDQSERLWHLLCRRGVAFGVQPVGWEALNIARIEAGRPWEGLDMTEESLLPETGLDTEAASDTKGCYLGQEIIARLQAYGSVSRKLMGLMIEGAVEPAAGEMIMRNGEEVGRITSACRSPALQCPIALGYLKRGSYEPGTAVQIRHGAARLAATVAGRPLVA